jgi:hypothetical protein
VAWTVAFHPSAEKELGALPAPDRVAVLHAVEKLAALGPTLPHPHQSDVRGGRGLRELRPRAGRSPWRAFYRRIGVEIVVGAFGSEAQVDPQGFARAVAAAEQRLDADEAKR